ncbi:HNH endonuclease [Streptomyces olivoreticuli]|uniref:HNH endonuclease n=1 Tax=Streptomyces olivoreticuli TaxID=68246 RepID=UPI0026583118|nr:HNH endonuclease [Streptomyces olivoreticuli]WKK26535.1 HNH endonuclease [Streptomyces olivoreticuli]
MSLHDSPHLSAARRRARKRTLARRDGARCTYCRRPFADLREATMDHVVPISLFHTWRSEHLVLACRPCNDRKANRLPLSVALLLCALTAPTSHHRTPAAPVHEHPAAPTGEHPTPTVHEHTTDTVHGMPGGAVHEQSGERVAPFIPDWALLAQLAYTRESADRSTAGSAGRSGQQSRADLPVCRARSADRSARTRLCTIEGAA